MIHAAWLLVLLTVLAVARVTRLINEDVIFDRPRSWVVLHAPGKVEYLITCPWCVSVWVGAAAAPLVYLWHCTWPVQIGLLALAASYVTGLLALFSGVLEKAAN